MEIVACCSMIWVCVWFFTWILFSFTANYLCDWSHDLYLMWFLYKEDNHFSILASVFSLRWPKIPTPMLFLHLNTEAMETMAGIPYRMGQITSLWNQSDRVENTVMIAEISFMSCYQSRYICWTFLRETSELGRPWKEAGVLESGWELGVMLPRSLILFCHSLVVQSLLPLWASVSYISRALILYKIVVKITNNAYETQAVHGKIVNAQ